VQPGIPSSPLLHSGHVQGRAAPDASRMIAFPRRMGVLAPPLSELRKDVKVRQKLRLAQRKAWRGRIPMGSSVRSESRA
jgi:hypothetical protein